MLLQGVFSYLVTLYICHASQVLRPKQQRPHRHHLDVRHFRDNWFGDIPDPFIRRGIFSLPCAPSEDAEDAHVDCASRNLEQSLCVTKMLGVLTSTCSYPATICEGGDCVKRFQPCFVGSEYDYAAKEIVHSLDPYRAAKEMCRKNRFNPFDMVRSFCCWTEECRSRCYPADVFGRPR
uniref:Domain of unknown function DB domain-containing protein n=1 Tax=Bursaphelenchus xylophilus TaxID=6326 RepID=A0A1I7SQZ7_BURXY